MTDPSKAKIFLSEERGLNERSSFRSYQTFNFRDYFNEYKIPFDNLYVLNDDSLAGGHSIKMTVSESSYIILLPVVGAISYKDSQGKESLINSGELQIISLPGENSFELTNPYQDELVNFLQLWIKSDSIKIASAPLLVSFNLEENKNRLLEILHPSEAAASYPACNIGQFRGREEAIYNLNNKYNGLFVFVIEGAFEVQGRLLHSRDGLALWDVEEPIELEALSNEAIVLLLEMKR